MEVLLEEILRRVQQGERAALCIVVATRGSTPQGRGAKMLVLQDGTTLGTLGGGCVEAEVRRNALQLLAAGQSRLLEFRLDHDYGWDDGLICGGVMEIYAQVLDRSASKSWQELLSAIRRKVPTTLRIPYEQNGLARQYVEEIGPPPRLIIAGGGHVGQALGEMMARLDFRVTVIDDRADYASADRFPSAEQRIVGDIEAELRRFPIDAGCYIVIVTRGHRHDGQALAAVIDSPAKYIGLIGSKSKIKLIFAELAANGVPAERLLRVHAPIGLNIGAVTVNEIAFSIAAELVNVRRGRQGKDTGALKLDAAELAKWLKAKQKE